MFPRSVIQTAIACSVGLALLLMTPLVAPADDITPDVRNWAATSNDWWHYEDSWDPAGHPEEDWIANIINPANTTDLRSYVVNDASVAEVNVYGGSTARTYLWIYNSCTLSVLNGLDVFDRGRLSIQAGNVTTGSLTINEGGNLFHDNGTLTIDGGTFDPLGNYYYVNGPAVGKLPSLVLKNGAGGDIPLTMVVGNNYAGELRVESGAHLTSYNGRIGWGNDTSNGSVTVDGNSSSWINTSDLEVATRNLGDMTISNYGLVQDTVGAIGAVAGSEGTVTVTDHGIWTNTATLYVGGKTAAGGQGTLIVEDGGSVTAASGMKVWPDGEVHLRTGGVLEATGGNVTLTGGRLRGDSELIIPADARLENDGVVDPQRVLRVVGGDYLQQPGGRLEIDLGGTDPELYDQLLINDGRATLGGTLVVSLSGGFIPEPGQRFDIVWAGDGVAGAFADVLLPTLPGGLSLDVRPVPSGLALVAVVPEPASLWLLLAGLAGALVERRRFGRCRR